jgi:hypothetical protein
VTREDLKNRLIKIDGKVLQDRVHAIKKPRRGLNSISLQNQDLEDIGDFFEFEKDLSQMESASSLAAKITKVEEVQPIKEEKIEYFIPQVIMPIYEEQKSIDSGSFLTLDDEPEIITETIKEEAEISNESKMFEFKNCQYMKEDGVACKRQAPKLGNYCSAHKKLIGRV